MKCIRVPKKDGEIVRSILLEEGNLNLDVKIKSEGDFILIPVLCDNIEGYAIEDISLEMREYRIASYKELVKIPTELLSDLPNSYDIIGDVAIVKFVNSLLPYSKDIGDALLSFASNLRVVMLDKGVKGEYRIRDLERIAGSGSSETIHKEFGVRISTDPSRVYFNPRLSSERDRIASEVKDDETVIDMFAGVAPFGTVIAKRSKPSVVYSIDLNPDAEYFMKKNMELNKVSNVVPMTGDSRDVLKSLPSADRIIMNLPQLADEFLHYALNNVKIGGIIHLYKILEREDLGRCEDSLYNNSKEKGYDIKIISSTELKTYAKTMSVYVFDIIRES